MMTFNTSARTLLPIIFSIASTSLMAEDRLNGREAASACMDEISNQYAEQASIKFGRNPASSMKGNAYTFWINATEEVDGEKDSLKYQCEITRKGELISLTREQGRWRI